MKFEKLSIDSFSKNALMDNKLRSVNGGGIATNAVEWDLDWYHNDGSTEYSDHCNSDDTLDICSGDSDDCE